MNLIEFVKNFPDEESYKRKWREIRERQGVVCPKCGCREHYWKNDKQSFECKHCGHRQSLIGGIIGDYYGGKAGEQLIINMY